MTGIDTSTLAIVAPLAAAVSLLFGTLIKLYDASLTRERQRGDRLEQVLFRLLVVADKSATATELLTKGPLS